MRGLFVFICIWFSSLLQSEELLVFYHIPKCGGTSIHSLIAQKFDMNDLYAVNGPGTNDPHYRGSKSLQDYQLNFDTLKFLYGHMPYSRFYIPDTIRVTFLRDPVERVFSHYRYVHLYGRANDFHELYKTLSNFQVRYLSKLNANDPNISLKEHLESAKRALSEEFAFVGITERMQESLALLYKQLQWEPLTYTPIFNTTVAESSHDPILYEFVYQNEWADRELYEFAKKIFNKYAEEHTNDPNPLPKPVNYTDTIQFDMTQPLDGEGWGYREFVLGKNNEILIVYRTSYLKDATIKFPLIKKDYTLRFVARSPRKYILDTLKLSINDAVIPFQVVSASSWKTFQAYIPQELITEGKKTTIQFHVPKLYKPSEEGGNYRDTRNLGIELKELSITAAKSLN